MGDTDRPQGGKNEKIAAAQEKKRRTIEKRQEREKIRILECLRKIPVIEVACRAAGVSRGTCYRWMDEDPTFAERVKQALREAVDLVSDKAESNIIAKINAGDIPTSKYWLDNRKKEYKKPRTPQKTDGENEIKTLIMDF